MSIILAAEIPAFDSARKALTLGYALHIDLLARSKLLYGKLTTNI